MSQRLKTLIVFDTNSLRSTQEGKVAYSFFAFGRPFQKVEEFISENNLSQDVQIAIPAWAIEELKDQKTLQYKEDIKEFEELASRLSGMPHVPQITIPDANFDCSEYIQEKSEQFLSTKKLKLIKIPESLANKVLQNMMLRVMKEERAKHPFVHAKKGNKTYKDAGFKDNLIWESLLHYPELVNYDKVIFLTGDSDYTNCKSEFVEKWNKHFTIIADENNAIAEINKDYSNYIEERAIHDYANNEYFKDYLFDQLKIKNEIGVNGLAFKIKSSEIKIINPCLLVERIPPTDENDECIIIHSEVIIPYIDTGEKKQRIVIIKTQLDEESKEIIDTNFDIELI